MSEVSGTRWRLLAHEGGQAVELENRGVFDELVLDDWLHVEQMDSDRWWLRVGDARINVRVVSGARVEVDIERGVYSEVIGQTTGA